MIYTVFMQRLDPYSHNLLFEVYDSNKNLIAEAKKDGANSTQLNYNGNIYEFPFAIKSIEKANFQFSYPVSSKKNKKLGYQIKKNNNVVAEYYGEVAVVEKRAIFSKKIGFEVFKYNGNVYYMVKVGLPKGTSHYYCLINATSKQTVGIIERLQANKEEARARIYLTNQANEELMLMLLSTETVMTVTSNAEGQIIDPSAGKYVSLREEERNFLDKNFIEMAQQN